ncbi:SDR family NAD(P)-dependent oxidoreductase [Mesorhizobium sp. NZP2298]|uniref:SDR family NAD(P)-dependent oxidoreductase n=1 Tax=Mesorhizobium sp. NZP2298 TaxID=2483403 RepID=UPI001555656D|nr:glucose 1-dehydrogenase [Mesorhizobium sp. NZP2298]QKC96601.1 glucose 1-dehydrogenase [Mesorhizobium sp. NZP2298]
MTKFLEFGLNGKVALVTGAGRGLGRSIALALAHAGADIAVNGSKAAGLASVAAEIKAMGRRVVEVPADLSDVALVGAMVKKAESALGPIDILVNNAGINQVEPSLDVAPETWDRLMDVNLRAPFFCAQAVAGGMIERRRGKIINIASDAGIVGYAGHAAYGTTKGGLIQLTRILAVEWGPHNVQVNAICPGATWSDMTTPAMQKPEIARELLARGVAGRITDPEEIGAAAVFLASEASNMIIGQALGVEGGSIAK